MAGFFVAPITNLTFRQRGPSYVVIIVHLATAVADNAITVARWVPWDSPLNPNEQRYDIPMALLSGP